MWGPATEMSSPQSKADTSWRSVFVSHVWSEHVAPSELRFQIAKSPESSGSKSRNGLLVMASVPVASVHVTISPVASALRCHTTRLPATRGLPSGTALLLTCVVVTSVAEAASGAPASAIAQAMSVRRVLVMAASLPIGSGKSTLAAARSGNCATNVAPPRVLRVVRPEPRLDARERKRGEGRPLPLPSPSPACEAAPPGDVRTVEPVSVSPRRPS